jgi:DNA-binding NarL/FixJ family response regulator
MIRVLLADDHVVVRRMLRQLIELEGDLVIAGEAGDGCEAVRLAYDRKPDIAIIDLQMPGGDGLEATSRICERSPETAVLILTMHDSAAAIAGAFERGARGYLLKSEATEHLVAAIRTVTRREQVYMTPSIAAIVESDRR